MKEFCFEIFFLHFCHAFTNLVNFVFAAPVTGMVVRFLMDLCVWRSRTLYTCGNRKRLLEEIKLQCGCEVLQFCSHCIKQSSLFPFLVCFFFPSMADWDTGFHFLGFFRL